MAEGDDGKTEEPSGKKLSEARSEGNIPRSADLASAILLLFGTILLFMFSKNFARQLRELMIVSFEAIPQYDQFVGNIPRLGTQSYTFLLKLLLPFMLTLAIVSIVANITQFGPLWSRQVGKFDLAKMFSPTNFLKFISITPLLAIPKNILKMAVIGAMAYIVVHRQYEDYLGLADQSPGQIVDFISRSSRELLIKCASLLMIIGLGDFFFTKRQYRKKLMMTKQEVKDEMKASEGDPRIKGKIKSLRRQMFQRIMAKELPHATVVITNPTFIAIALRYEQGKDRAPMVLAKGKRLMAERIRDMAKSKSIPIIEDRPLARGLFEVAEVGEEIPAEFFSAVAEILATVYSLKNLENSRSTV